MIHIRSVSFLGEASCARKAPRPCKLWLEKGRNGTHNKLGEHGVEFVLVLRHGRVRLDLLECHGAVFDAVRDLRWRPPAPAPTQSLLTGHLHPVQQPANTNRAVVHKSFNRNDTDKTCTSCVPLQTVQFQGWMQVDYMLTGNAEMDDFHLNGKPCFVCRKESQSAHLTDLLHVLRCDYELGSQNDLWIPFARFCDILCPFQQRYIKLFVAN